MQRIAGLPGQARRTETPRRRNRVSAEARAQTGAWATGSRPAASAFPEGAGAPRPPPPAGFGQARRRSLPARRPARLGIVPGQEGQRQVWKAPGCPYGKAEGSQTERPCPLPHSLTPPLPRSPCPIRCAAPARALLSLAPGGRGGQQGRLRQEREEGACPRLGAGQEPLSRALPRHMPLGSNPNCTCLSLCR